ncbi:response regulator transcription factor [Tumebacillus lipolyticus]|uniref:Response regulator transcription factor n=1 Tax=Tumebacillus lipolyticus TaxID=1280370 RepID=A0ABW4ZYH8_9BACL
MKVLVLEDEESIRGFVRINLQRNGFTVIEAETGEEALLAVEREADLHLAILDVMLPTISGIEVCQMLREKYPLMGILLLTAKGQELDKVEGLNAGADDYVVKPFSPLELVARLQALMRRMGTEAKARAQVQSPEQSGHLIISGPFVLQVDERRFLQEGREVMLTPKEFEIVQLFLENQNHALSRDEILDAVWGRYFTGDPKVVDVNIRRIRQKLGGDEAQILETIWGYGYRWKQRG